MTPEDVRAHLARLSAEARDRMSDDARRFAEQQAAAPATSRRRAWAPYDSKWERDYARVLAYATEWGDVAQVEHHPAPLICAGGTKYTPDFRVEFTDGRTEYHEVKGHLRDRDAVRMREAAAVSAWPIVVLTKQRGSWIETRRYPALGNTRTEGVEA